MQLKLIPRLILLTAIFSFVTGCTSSAQSKLTGTLKFKIQSFYRCENYLGQLGEVSSGKGEILGTVKLSTFESNPTADDFTLCSYRFSGAEINLQVDVLVVKFQLGNEVDGKWILQPSEFRDGEISLVGGTPFSD